MCACLLWMLLCGLSLVRCGVLEYKVTLKNPVDGKKLPVIIHYPSDKSERYPVIVFNHGWTCHNTWYNYVWQKLVPQGYIVAMPGDDETDIPTENIFEYSAGQRYTLDWIVDDCAKDHSCPLAGIIGDKFACSGHSMGGGATLLSIADYPVGYTSQHRFDAALTLSGCNPNEKVLKACKDITRPILLLTGSRDCICPPHEYADKYYAAVPGGHGSCKYLGDITNGTHCNFEDNGLAEGECDIAEFDLCPFEPHQHISDRAQWNISTTYMAQFFKATLKDGDNSQDLKRLGEMLEQDVKAGVMYSHDTQQASRLTAICE